MVDLNGVERAVSPRLKVIIAISMAVNMTIVAQHQMEIHGGELISASQSTTIPEPIEPPEPIKPPEPIPVSTPLVPEPTYIDPAARRSYGPP